MLVVGIVFPELFAPTSGVGVVYSPLLILQFDHLLSPLFFSLLFSICLWFQKYIQSLLLHFAFSSLVGRLKCVCVCANSESRDVHMVCVYDIYMYNFCEACVCIMHLVYQNV